MLAFKEKVEKALAKVLAEPFVLEIPANPLFGDFALPCFKLSKKPHELQKVLKLPGFIEKTEMKGLYLNFFIKKDLLAKATIEEIQKRKEKYGSLDLGGGKKALIEHTSINPNASPHLGRARNAMIGDVLARLLRFQAFKTEVQYFVNDVGKQIAMLVLACKGRKPSFHELLEKYVQFNQDLAKNPSLEQEVFALLSRFEAGDKKTIAEFRRVVKVCIDGQTALLKEFGITYDRFVYESEYLLKKETGKVLNDLEKTEKVFVDEQKRKVVNLEGFNLPMEHPVLPLTRGDGTSLYMLRDLVYTQEKVAQKPALNVIVLGEDQKLYFQQLKAILSLLNVEAPRVVHYAYVLLKEGKMATREGNVVLLEEFMQEAVKKAAEEVEKRKIAQKDKEKIAQMIGYGAVKFAFLRVSAEKNIVFEWEKALSFEGESGPYIQYAHARACSILERVIGKGKVDFSLIKMPEEQALVAKLAQFPQISKDAYGALQTHMVANYALELAKVFNEFYHACPVMQADEAVKNVRIQLVESFVRTIQNALALLGIDAPKEM